MIPSKPLNLSAQQADPLVVVAEARTWIGTPYLHQASCKGAGSDCLGLIRGIWRHLFGAEPMAVPAYSADWADWGQNPPLEQVLAAFLIPKDHHAIARGDILLFQMRAAGPAKHLGVMSQGFGAAEAHFIHAFSGHSVCESALTPPWKRRILASFAFPAPAKLKALATS